MELININEGDIQKKKMLKKFIYATTKIIKNEGIENVTIRKVAGKAGYNSATIYNYFDNCKQLIFFASINFISDYVLEMPTYIEDSNNPLERLIKMWEHFSLHSFKNPKIYYAIFSENLGDKSENLIKNYYKIFPEELNNAPNNLLPMLLESDLSKRSKIAIRPCIDQGYLNEKEAKLVDEGIRLTYHGMLTLIINNRVDYTPQEATDHLKTHIKTIINNYI
ncbi:MAG: TetR/AcrR family transcriptional regulator [Bacillota bacterium]